MQGVSLSILRDHISQQKGNFFLWAPVFLGTGIGIYYSLPYEPNIWKTSGFIICAMLIMLGISSLITRPVFINVKRKILEYRSYLIIFTIIIILILAGFLSSQIRTTLVNTPILEKKLGSAMVEGRVASVEPIEEGSGSKIVLKDVIIENIESAKTPKRIRLRLQKNMKVLVGQQIKTLAALNPPSGPITPESFDFRRNLYFNEIGAVGFVFKQPEILHEATYYTQGIEGLRQTISQHIDKTLNPKQSSIATALMIGQQKNLSKENIQSLRDSGLAHMLSISGLHISLFAGTIFFLSRLLMAIIPNLALKHPIKKYAAVIAMLSAIFYMLIAGSTAPTVRSTLSIGIVFLAIILDRSPISLRLVAFSALVILLLQPENLLSVSFQMSFAAVTGLIAFFESTRNFWTKWNTKASTTQKSLIYLCGICATTIIATLTTTIFSIYHFQQFAFMGVIANLLAVPILSFMIMPLIIISFFLMPIGLDFLPLKLVGAGIEIILLIAHSCASLPFAVIQFQSIPFIAFILIIIAGLWIIIWAGHGKIVAVIPIIIAIFIIKTQKLPDILISENHKLFGFMIENKLYVSTQKAEKFTRENWEKFYALPKNTSILLPKNQQITNQNQNQKIFCDSSGCRITIKNKKVSFVKDPYILLQECAWADIIISTEPFITNKSKCKTKIIIDKFDTWREGAYAIWIYPKYIHKTSTLQTSGKRPWVKNPSAHHNTKK